MSHTLDGPRFFRLLHDYWSLNAFLYRFVAIRPAHGELLRDLKTCALVAITTGVAQRLWSPWTGLADRPDMQLLDRDDTLGIALPQIAHWSRRSTKQVTRTIASCAQAGRHLMLAFPQETVLMGITMLNNSLLVRSLHTLSSLTRTYRHHVHCTSS